MNNQTSTQIANYEREYKRLRELENSKSNEAYSSSSENEFKVEIKKMIERAAISGKER